MISALNSYIVTNGNGREAVDFYQDLFQAQVTNLMLWKDAIPDSPEEAKELYQKLSQNAQHVFLELQETFWSPAYANLIDQFGVMWQINTEGANA